MKGPTFSELYCARERITPSEVPERLFRATLYPHARPFVGLIRLVRQRHFLADYEFIEDVGYLRSLEDFSLALGCYIEHPDNHGFLRRRLHVRVSARRMLRIVRSIFTPAVRASRIQRDTFEPFAGPGGAGPPPSP
ncbi:MAG TPA: hypothetical protein VHD61_15915 [Lacunisphaera sp.]|nr:hypothetical protein [Lacunisphaera sp.]